MCASPLPDVSHRYVPGTWLNCTNIACALCPPLFAQPTSLHKGHHTAATAAVSIAPLQRDDSSGPPLHHGRGPSGKGHAAWGASTVRSTVTAPVPGPATAPSPPSSVLCTAPRGLRTRFAAGLPAGTAPTEAMGGESTVPSSPVVTGFTACLRPRLLAGIAASLPADCRGAASELGRTLAAAAFGPSTVAPATEEEYACAD